MNDTKIKLIRKMPDGPRLFELWIGILCLGMKSGRPGVLEIGDGISFDEETLSTELDIALPIVRLGLETFIKLKMIEIFETGEIYLTNFENHQQLEKIAYNKRLNRERVKKHRDKIKDVMHYKCISNENVSPSDLDLDKDLDKDIKKRDLPPKTGGHILINKSGQKEITDYFFKKYQEKMDIKPTWGGKEGKLLQQDLKRLDNPKQSNSEIIKMAIDLFFEDKVLSVVKFVKEKESAGYTYGVFHGVLDSILLAMRKK